MATDLRIDREFQVLIPPLDSGEQTQLEASLKADGCRDPLIVWKDHGILLHGHNRKRLCDKHDIPFKTVEVDLPNREAAKAFIIQNQLARRNLTPEAASYLRGRRYLEMKQQGKRTDLAAGEGESKAKESASRPASPGWRGRARAAEREGAVKKVRGWVWRRVARPSSPPRRLPAHALPADILWVNGHPLQRRAVVVGGVGDAEDAVFDQPELPKITPVRLVHRGVAELAFLRRIQHLARVLLENVEEARGNLRVKGVALSEVIDPAVPNQHRSQSRRVSVSLPAIVVSPEQFISEDPSSRCRPPHAGTVARPPPGD
jgi:hypothetical protein